MESYNRQDVILLEKVYYRLRPWMDNHPNLSLLNQERNCPHCGSEAVRKEGIRAAHLTLKQQYQCKDCGSWFLKSLGKKLPNYGE
jgi:DNA-directed RNA polymerase subunit RPC12/RpoP